MNAPGMIERITSKKYRFSILRFIYILDTLFRSIKVAANSKVEWALRHSAPFFIGEAMVVVTNLNKALYPFLGLVMAEIVLFLRSRVINPAND